MAALTEGWHFEVSATAGWPGWPGASALLLGETASWTQDFSLSVAARQLSKRIYPLYKKKKKKNDDNDDNNDHDDDDHDHDHDTKKKKKMMMITRMALTSAISDVLQSFNGAANCLQHVRSEKARAQSLHKSDTTHPGLITCNTSCVTWYMVPRNGSDTMFDSVELTFISASADWLKPLPDEEGEETGESAKNMAIY